MSVAELPRAEINRLRLGPADAGRLLSREEYAEADYAEPYKYERVHGRLVVMSPAGPEHRFVSRPFRRKLSAYWEEHLSLVEDVDIEGWVATSPDDDRLPDICVYLIGEDPTRRVPDRVPTIIFEFVSQSRADKKRDYREKRDEYHSIGVKEYVVVDRFKRSVLILTWQPDGYTECTLTEHDFYSTPLLPNLVIPLSEAFSEPPQ